MQVTATLKAQPGERTDERLGYRNGFRDREIQTRIGTITLRVPRTREGEFSPELWERYQRSEQAFVLALCEMVLQGVSTRKVEAITQELCGASFGKSLVSKLCLALDPLVKQGRERPLGVFPFVLVDALVATGAQRTMASKSGKMPRSGSARYSLPRESANQDIDTCLDSNWETRRVRRAGKAFLRT